MASRHLDADVIVGGGGPAGSATAIACAQRGLRVVLFERDDFVRERPGETLHPGIEPLLAQLGVADRLPSVVGARHAGIWIEWGGGRRFEPFGANASGPWTGFQVWRQDFDALLIARAGELRVTVLQPMAVTGLAGQNVVKFAAGDATARIVIDASGPARAVAPALVADQDGWTWTAMVRPDLYQWTRLAFDGHRPDAARLLQFYRDLGAPAFA